MSEAKTKGDGGGDTRGDETDETSMQILLRKLLSMNKHQRTYTQ